VVNRYESNLLNGSTNATIHMELATSARRFVVDQLAAAAA
jgi:hypothetical protein